MYGRNQHNTVKQLSSSSKLKKKKLLKIAFYMNPKSQDESLQTIKIN